LKYRDHEVGWLEYIQDVGRVVDRLVALGYPTPRLVASGSLHNGIDYCLQGYIEGAPLDRLTREALPQVLQVIDRQANLDIPSKRDWCVMVYLAVCGEDSDVANVIHNHSPAGAELVVRIRQSLNGLDLADLPRADIVHGDFNTGNIIMNEGELAAVIDFQSVGRGTRVIDLATLLFNEWAEVGDTEIAKQLRDHAVPIAGEKVLLLCLARSAFARIQGAVLRRESGYVADHLVDLSHRLVDWLRT
jgi:phosphotransferase family enzyme